jgi:hypothetical protein
MSKRPGSATEANPPKRARKPTGFRVARPLSALQSTAPSNSSNSTLHVTVNPRRGNALAFSNTPEQPARSSTPATHSNFPEPTGDTQHHHDDILDPLPESPPVAEVPLAPKRKRNTKNGVSYHSVF